MRSGIIRFATAACATLFLGLSLAQANEVIEEIPFDGDTIIVTDTGNGEQIISINDEEIARNYYASFDRVTKVEDAPVAIFYMSDGGNSCGPTTLLIWRDIHDGKIKQFDHDEDCQTPAPSISDDAIFFIPYLNPGESRLLNAWSPSSGISSKGQLSFAPQAGTGWADLKAKPASHPIDFFQNEVIHDMAKKLTGDDFAVFAKGLSVAVDPRPLRMGVIMASGCTPHNCGVKDSLILIDEENQTIFLAQQNENDFNYWPPKDQWTPKANEAFDIFISSR